MVATFNYFNRLEISSPTFGTDPDVVFGFQGNPSFSLINEGENVIEYSFDGVTLHGDLTSSSATAAMAFNSRGYSAIWFRLADGAAGNVRIEATQGTICLTTDNTLINADLQVIAQQLNNLAQVGITSFPSATSTEAALNVAVIEIGDAFQYTIGADDIDLTVDPDNGVTVYGPISAIEILSAGTLSFETQQGGVGNPRVFTGLTTGSNYDGIKMTKIIAADTTVTGIRVRW